MPRSVGSAGRHATRQPTPGPSSGPPAATNISAVTGSPFAASAAPPSLSPTLPKRLTAEHRASFLHVWERLPTYLRSVALAASVAFPAVTRISHRVGLRLREPQGHHQRKCRFPVSFARACNRRRPQWIKQLHPFGRWRHVPLPCLPASHPFLSDPQCWLEWAGVPPRARCFG